MQPSWIFHGLGFLLPLGAPLAGFTLSNPTNKGFWGYVTILTLTTKSTQYHQGMTMNLNKMTASMSLSAELGSKSEADAVAAEASMEKAKVEAEESGALKEEAAALEEESVRYRLKAAEDETEMETFAEAAASEQAESIADAAKAAEDAAIVDAETEIGIEETASFAEDEAIEDADAGITLACQAIPFVDAVCTIVGGIGEAIVTAKAAIDAAAAAADFTAAAAAEVREEAEAEAAAELEAKSLKDSAAAGNAEERMAADTAASEAEHKEAVVDEEEAAGLDAKSAADTEMADEEKSKSVSEAAESDEEIKRALKYAFSAFGNATMAALSGLVSLLFFLVRAIRRWVFPGLLFVSSVASLAWSNTIQIHQSELLGLQDSPNVPENTVIRTILKQTSYWFIHATILFSTIGSFSSQWQIFDKISIQSKGGLILSCALLATAVQLSLLHVLPEIHYHFLSTRCCQGMKSFLYAAMRIIEEAFFLISLFVTEYLILWVILGSKAGTIPALVRFGPPMLWGILLLIWLLHFWLFEVIAARHVENSSENSSDKNTYGTMEEGGGEYVGNDVDSNVSQQLISSGSSPMEGGEECVGNDIDSNVSQQLTGSAYSSFSKYCRRMQIPIEVLLASCLAVILWGSLPVCYHLYSKIRS